MGTDTIVCVSKYFFQLDLPGIHESASGRNMWRPQKLADISMSFFKCGRYKEKLETPVKAVFIFMAK